MRNMQFSKWEFNRFVVVGVLNTFIYYGVYLLNLHGFHVPYMLAHGVAVAVSIVGSFFLNTTFTYRVRPTFKKFLLFPLTQVLNIVVTMALLYVLVDGLRMNSSFAPLAALVVTVPVTYLVTGRVLKTT